jgi:hypothetical protein
LNFHLDLVRLQKYEAAPAHHESVVGNSRGLKSDINPLRPGAIAQLGERLHGMQEVSGSIPLGSTISSLFHFRRCRVRRTSAPVLSWCSVDAAQPQPEVSPAMF